MENLVSICYNFARVFDRLAHLTFAHPKSILAGTAVFVLLSFAVGGRVADLLKPAGFTDPQSESSRAEEQATAALGYDPKPGIVVIATNPDGPITAPAARAEVRSVAEQLGADRDVARTLTPFDRRAPRTLISRDGSSAMILANFSETDEGLLEDAAARIPDTLSADRLRLQVGGSAIAFNDVNEQVESDLIRAEMIAFPILAILLVIVFRGFVAASLPLIIGIIAVAGTFLSLRILTGFTDVSIFALNITTALGLGLAVDYGLLLTSRYREELERSGPGWEAHLRTAQTAGRAVFFSGLTVSAAVASMIILPQRFLYSMGAGAAIVALLAAAAALLVTPAMLSLLGDRVNALAVRPRKPTPIRSGRWYRLASWVMRRPVTVAFAVTFVLLALASPLRDAVLTQPGTDAVPAGKESRIVSERLAAEFTPNIDSPIGVTVERSAAPRLIREAREIAPGAVTPPTPLGRGERVYFQVTPADGPLTPAAQDTVRRLRDGSRAEAGSSAVSGTTADFVDFKRSLLDHAPLVALLIAGSTLILLFLMTGSAILPIKTLLMNVLSIAAAIGIVVLVFQEGFGAGLFGYDGPEALETALIVVLGATTFGLATDYAVLVLARIKEFHDRGEETAEAIALGIDRTGRVITAAALLLAVVFLAFTTGAVFFMKEVGLGQAVAVAIDASIVRALLVPALMKLLGEWNWWAPGPLRRLHRRLGLSEPAGEPPAEAEGDARALA